MEAKIRAPTERTISLAVSDLRGVFLVLLIGIGVVIASYYVAGTSFLAADILFYLFLWAGAGMAWAIHAGLAGRLSVGHAAYFGIGAYTAALFQTRFGLSVWLAFPVAALLSGLIGAIVELVIGRLEGIYYALATFAFAQLLWLVARSWRDLTRGTAGITIPFDARKGVAGLMFTDAGPYVASAGVAALVCLGCFLLINRGRLGYFVRALRDAPNAAAAIGLSANKWRAWTAAISAGLTSIIGIIFIQNVLFVDPDTVLGFRISVLVMLPAIVGGLNITYGAIVGAAIIVPIRQWLLAGGVGESVSLQWILYGIALTTIVLLMPDGVVGFVRDTTDKLRHDST